MYYIIYCDVLLCCDVIMCCGGVLAGLATFLSESALCGQGLEKVDPRLLVPSTGVSHGLDMICE